MKKVFILVALAGLFALMSFSMKVEQVDPVVNRICDEEATAAGAWQGWDWDTEMAWYDSCVGMNS